MSSKFVSFSIYFLKNFIFRNTNVNNYIVQQYKYDTLLVQTSTFLHSIDAPRGLQSLRAGDDPARPVDSIDTRSVANRNRRQRSITRAYPMNRRHEVHRWESSFSSDLAFADSQNVGGRFQ